MTADDPSAEFADGLQLNRLHPPAIISFMQGLSRRAADAFSPDDSDTDTDPDQDHRSEEGASDAETGKGHATAPHPSAPMDDEALDPLLDTLAGTVQRLQEAGFAPDRDVRDHASERVQGHADLARVNAAALQAAQLVAGVPDRAWTEQPDLLDDVRSLCAQASRQLAALRTAARDRLD